ncbi:sporulation-delaying protein SdpB family protein [Virgibacillus sp. Bac330]|uniref:sporulation-delaying protein SdpB family protein n=1 Tax=Virgibacillus sp. Bac330 TaxID=2419841 RepID=UPI000EF482EE|nr:sporulation-delaying protein SdpB family protein [Virgibacillus sp. Bac330]
MLNEIEAKIDKFNPFTNVYGLSRSILALSTLLTLLLNDTSIFFRPFAGSNEYPLCSENSISLYCLVPNNTIYLEVIRWASIVILTLVISGWRPRITGVLHWWVTYSLWGAAIGLDGGDQVTAVFTLLLIPITLADPRKNHWEQITIQKGHYIGNKIITLVTHKLIRIQVAIIYFHSTIAKLSSEEWINGTAVWYYLQSPMLGVPHLIEGPIMKLLSTSFVVFPTWGTLIMQSILVLALFAPKKYWKIIFVFAVLMHEIFALFLGLVSFSLAMLAILILYLFPLEKNIIFKNNPFLKIKLCQNISKGGEYR